MDSRNLWSAVVIVAALGAGSALAQGAAAGGDKSKSPTAAAAGTSLVIKKDIIGKSIANEQKTTLGTVDDAVLDRSGNVKYLLISPSKELNMGKAEVAVPWHALAISQQGGITLPMSKEQFSKAPTWKQLQQQAAAQTDWDTMVYEYYGLVFVPEQAVFAQLDKNSDGRLSRDEAATNRTIGTNFKKLDKNSDGSLSKAEFSAWEEAVGTGASGGSGSSSGTMKQ